MLVLCCGSRGWTDHGIIFQALKGIRDTVSEPVTVLEGGANGADHLSGVAAGQLGMSVRVIRPDWGRYGRRAGLIRNDEMLDMRPDRVLAFWDGVSNGTRYTIDGAKRRGIPVTVFTKGE